MLKSPNRKTGVFLELKYSSTFEKISRNWFVCSVGVRAGEAPGL